MNGSSTRPMLTEPGVKFFISETLKQCRQFKDKYQNDIINTCLFFGLLVILGAFLLYKYKGKLTPEEMREKENEKKQYILSKIKNFQLAKLKAQQSLITGLPHWEDIV
jgi:hypothetical protein